jgi:hypothetical protein
MAAPINSMSPHFRISQFCLSVALPKIYDSTPAPRSKIVLGLLEIDSPWKQKAVGFESNKIARI